MTDRNADSTCRCGKPARDSAYFCDDCAHSLSVALGEIPWLDEELDITVTRQKGVDYRTKGGTRASERPSPVVWSASEARGHLRGVLVSWVRFCADEQVRNSSPHQGVPEDSLPAISRWLLWRVDGLSLLDIGPEAVDEITSAVAHCHRLIDRPSERQYLGQCQECDEEGRLYCRPGGAMARCNVCGSVVNAEEVRTRMLTELDDRLCTAGEIAHLSTYLGLKASRDQVRKHVEYLARKGRIARQASFSTQATYRFGEVYQHLIGHDYRKAS